VFLEDANGRWRVEVRDFARFREALGQDVLREFARCFVHADRLVSLTSFAFHSQEIYGTDSIAFKRNLQTMLWFVVGTLREFALAIRSLRSALAKRGLLEPDSAPWLKLRELEARWEKDSFFRDMRNVVAFHVDAAIVDRGLDALASAGKPVIVTQGDGEKQDLSSLHLGLEAVFMGGEKNEDDFNRFFGVVADDHGTGAAVSEVFLAVLERLKMMPVPIDESTG
jgi:hypothetical protein